MKLGIGDDTALVAVAQGMALALTTDFSIESVHFSAKLHPPQSVGHRALARSLSDIAAVGGIPKFALISLAISNRTTRAWIEAFYGGLIGLAKRFGVAVIGGDTAVVSGPTTVDVIVAGVVEPARALRRSGARPGDGVYVSGPLGLSALGLQMLKSGARSQGRRTSPAVHAHLYPEPRCMLGRFLSQRRLASALIDISDGLSTDLGHLCEASQVGARIWADRIPKQSLLNGPRLDREAQLNLALHGGEDYQLLFTVSPRKSWEIPGRFQGVHLHRIGQILGSRKVLLVDGRGKQVVLRPGGYDHFRKA